MSRIEELEARRRALVKRCATQRAELALRAEELKQAPLARFVVQLTQAGESSHPLRQPLTWVAALGALVLLRRPRALVSLLTLAPTAISFATRAGAVLKLISELRGRRSNGVPAPKA